MSAAGQSGGARQPDIFLSYSRLDADRATAFANALVREGFEVWWDVRLRSGETFDKAVENALAQARAVVVLWTHNSVGSTWVRSEASVGFRTDKLRPVMLEPCDLPVMFELVQAAPLIGWHGETDSPGWQRLVAELRELIGSPAEAAPQPPMPAAATAPAPPPPPAQPETGAKVQRFPQMEPPPAEGLSLRRKLFNLTYYCRTNPSEHEKRLIVTWCQALLFHLVFFGLPMLLLIVKRSGG